MKNNYSSNLASQGEKLAQNYLENHGYSIIATNYHSSYGEIDIIASINQSLVFVEVKTRSHNNLEISLNNISKAKQQKISKTADVFINQANVQAYLNTRFDVIIISFDKQNDNYSISHIQDAFSPLY